MTQAQYARRRNTSPQYIGKLARAGVLVMRGRLLDAVASDAVLDDKPAERSAPVKERWAAILVVLKERILAVPAPPSLNVATPANRLVYIAQVSTRVERGAYFELPRFQHRQDAIYERAPDGQLVLRPDARAHNENDHRLRDVGRPPRYARANALVCSDFRYLGANGTDDWKRHAPRLTALVEGLGQGHRVNFTPELVSELLALKHHLWTLHPITKVLGKPLHDPNAT